MDMRINPETIKSERTKRAWSQDQLAAASGLSLRTVQRIEKTGVAASESVQSLAAALDCTVGALVESAATRGRPLEQRTRFWTLRMGVAFSGGALFGVLIAGSMTASAVDLKVQGYLNGKQLVDRKEASTEPLTIPLNDEQARERARVNIQVSELKDGRVRFDLTLFECRDGACAVSSRPAMITRPGVPAKVVWTSTDGDVFTYEITPTT